MSRLRLHVEGPHGAVPFKVFVDVLNRSRLILAELDRAISHTRSGRLDWRIVDLGIASADAVIEAWAPQQEAELPQYVCANFIDGLNAIEGDEGGVFPAYFSEQSLKRVKAISKAVNHDGEGATGFQAVDVDRNSEAHITPRAQQHVTQLLAPRFTALGSIRGTLEVISVHRKQTFHVYEARTKRAVRCDFDPTKLDAVKDALGKRVAVGGTLHRNVKGDAIRVEQPDLVVLPSAENLPTTADLYGMAPDFTGTMRVDEYMRELRCA